MADRKFLFVCSRNQWRSPTAEKIWRNTNGIQVRSAGTSPKARRKISASDLQWADRIFVMEGKHKERLQAQFSNLLEDKPIHILDIPDSYDYMDEELVEILTVSISPFIPES